MFDFGEDLFDRIEVGTIGRQAEQMCACRTDGVKCRFGRAPIAGALTVMTTNNAKLYRGGRVDKVMWFAGLDESAAAHFVVSILKTFGVDQVVQRILEGGHRHLRPGDGDVEDRRREPADRLPRRADQGVYSFIKAAMFFLKIQHS
jgi:hypothetical protein